MHLIFVEESTKTRSGALKQQRSTKNWWSIDDRKKTAKKEMGSKQRPRDWLTLLFFNCLYEESLLRTESKKRSSLITDSVQSSRQTYPLPKPLPKPHNIPTGHRVRIRNSVSITTRNCSRTVPMYTPPHAYTTRPYQSVGSQCCARIGKRSHAREETKESSGSPAKFPFTGQSCTESEQRQHYR